MTGGTQAIAKRNMVPGLDFPVQITIVMLTCLTLDNLFQLAKTPCAYL